MPTEGRKKEKSYSSLKIKVHAIIHLCKDYKTKNRIRLGLYFPKTLVQIYVASSETFPCNKGLFIIIIVILINKEGQHKSNS